MQTQLQSYKHAKQEYEINLVQYTENLTGLVKDLLHKGSLALCTFLFDPIVLGNGKHAGSGNRSIYIYLFSFNISCK